MKVKYVVDIKDGAVMGHVSYSVTQFPMRTYTRVLLKKVSCSFRILYGPQ